MDLTTATPVEIDTALSEIWQRRYALQHQAATRWEHVKDYVEHVYRATGVFTNWRDRATVQQVRDFLAEHSEISENEEMQQEAYPNRRAFDYAKGAWKAYENYNDLMTAADEALMETEPYDEEFSRRGGWTRFFLVKNNGGHIHSSMHCSTCFATTQFGWLPDLSGLTEAEAVAAHGAILCTVCYPSAPVEWTDGHDDSVCPGTGTWDYDKASARTGFYSGNYGTCNHCSTRVTLNKGSWKMRKHAKA